MKTLIRVFAVTALIVTFETGISTSTARADSIEVADLAGKWVIVQSAVVKSIGVTEPEGPELPGLVPIAGVTLFFIEADGSCARKSFSNFDGFFIESSGPLLECTVTVDSNGIGRIVFKSSLSSTLTEVRFIVINKDEIAAITRDWAVSAFTIKRQVLDDFNNDDDKDKDIDDD